MWSDWWIDAKSFQGTIARRLWKSKPDKVKSAPACIITGIVEDIRKRNSTTAILFCSTHIHAQRIDIIKRRKRRAETRKRSGSIQRIRRSFYEATMYLVRRILREHFGFLELDLSHFYRCFSLNWFETKAMLKNLAVGLLNQQYVWHLPFEFFPVPRT